MHQTNIIGASINLVDRFAHLETEELTRLKEDSSVWYVRTKDELFEAHNKPKEGVKPKGLKQLFVWYSEKWYVRLLIGLLFTLIVLPWVRRKSHEMNETVESSIKGRRSGRTRQFQFDENGYDREGYDRDGFDEDGYDRDGVHEDEYEDEEDFD